MRPESWASSASFIFHSQPSPVAAELTRAGSPESASFTSVISPSTGA
jgi:hypothetical protein